MSASGFASRRTSSTRTPDGHLVASVGQRPCGGVSLRAWSFVFPFLSHGTCGTSTGQRLRTHAGGAAEDGWPLSALATAGWFDARNTGGWDAHDWAEPSGQGGRSRREKEREQRAYRE